MPHPVILVFSWLTNFKKLKSVRKDCSEELYFFADPFVALQNFRFLQHALFCSYTLWIMAQMLLLSFHILPQIPEKQQLCSCTWTTNTNLWRSAVKILWLFLLHNVHMNPLNRNVISFLSTPIAILIFTVLKRPLSSKQSFLLRILCICTVMQSLCLEFLYVSLEMLPFI